MSDTTEDTLDALKKAQANPTDLAKGETQGWQQATGLVHYDLERPAKKLYPVITPLRNMIPRVPGAGGTATNWKAITGINTTKMHMGVGEADRSGFITNKLVDYTASYKGLGLESFVTFESEYASQNFDDVRARAVESLLRSFFIGEEQVILGGNNSLALGTAGTPTISKQAHAGSVLSTGAQKVRVVALTHDGFYRSSVANGVPRSESRVPGDGGAAVTVNAGSSQISAASSALTVATGDSLFATTADVRGAFAYAWYWGAAGSEKLGAITTTTTVNLVADAAGELASVHATSPADQSQDSTIYDGILTQISTASNNSYYKVLDAGTYATLSATNVAGTPLKGDNAGGIVQIDEALESFWDTSRLSPELMIVSAQELKNMTHILIKGGSAPLFSFTAPGGGSPGVDQLTLSGGTVIGQYLNKFTMSGGQMLKIMIHPNIAPGTVLFFSSSAPYPLSNVNNVLQIKERRSYYQIDWPLQRRRQEFGIYCDALLQMYFPPSFGVIKNIADGVA